LIPAQETSDMRRRQTGICFFKAGWFIGIMKLLIYIEPGNRGREQMSKEQMNKDRMR